jgi:hypothetical protein
MNAAQFDHVNRQGVSSQVEIGGTAVEIFDRWLTADSPPLPRERRYTILDVAVVFAEDVEQILGDVREHVSPRLAVAMSEVVHQRRQIELVPDDVPLVTDVPSCAGG